MVDEQRPVKMTLPSDIAIALDDIATRIKREKGNWRIGAGTVAAEIVEKVIREYPDLLKSFFADAPSDVPVAVEPKTEYAAKQPNQGTESIGREKRPKGKRAAA